MSPNKIFDIALAELNSGVMDALKELGGQPLNDPNAKLALTANLITLRSLGQGMRLQIIFSNVIGAVLQSHGEEGWEPVKQLGDLVFAPKIQ